MIAWVRVELEDVGKSYDGERWAVRHLKLEIPHKSVFGLIGPNGAGKSTTLRIIATVMAPTEGRVLLDGEAIGADLLAARRRIGFLGDGNPLYAELTPIEYLQMFGRCFQMRGGPLRAAVDRTIERFGLGEVRDVECGALSKGMRQRVLIARTLIHSPELLILDEPADGLDPAGRADLRRLLSELRGEGVTVVISSHILRELDELCDRVAMIKAGSLVSGGTVDEFTAGIERLRFSFDIQVIAGRRCALDLLAARGLAPPPGPDEDDHSRSPIRVEVASDEAMVELLRELTASEAQVITCTRVRTRLEDVYTRLSGGEGAIGPAQSEPQPQPQSGGEA